MPQLTAISLHQPYASLIFAGAKFHETRHWPFPEHMIGKRLAIHAAKKGWQPERGDPMDLVLLGAHGHEGLNQQVSLLPRGLLGTVMVDYCRPTDGPRKAEPVDFFDMISGDWSPRRFVTRLSDPRAFPAPISMAGRQKFWTVDVPEGF